MTSEHRRSAARPEGTSGSEERSEAARGESVQSAPRGLFVGLATLDVIYRIPTLPGPDEKLTARDRLVLAGGPAANAAVAFAGLGGAATLVTSLGRHPLAQAVTADLAAAGVRCVDTTPDRDDPPPTSSVYVLCATGQRSVVSDNGVHHDAGWADLRPWCAGAEVVLVDGHHPRLARAATDAAAREGVAVVVDAGSWKPVFAEILPRADLVLCSAQFRLPGTPPDTTGAALLARGAAAVGISDGPRPLRWATADGAGEVPVPAVTAVDTLGAGDVLHGAACHGVARSGVLIGALRRWLPWAVTIASGSCTRPGTRAWLAGDLPTFPG